ncbi:hypothetical protein DFP72DRAFT_1083009 [Ephemerocybe angulata]|uniref:Uncharacterized protein n=1 Tax=Ephemerocybe angulata TaxID=980116 RepID=A0A8H6H9M8_9AGAR|nr:hypothetical protein DFP72DRAFT_1083009 [Tulosesus angulatus]
MHLHARRLLMVPMGACPATSLNYVCQKVMESAISTWHTQFLAEGYRESQYLQLHAPSGAIVQPVYAKGSAWLNSVADDKHFLCPAPLTISLISPPPMSSSFPNFAKLNGTNYSTRSDNLEAWLKAHGLWHIVPPPPPSPRSQQPSTTQQELRDTFEAKCAELQEAWEAKGNKAAGWIWLTLEQDQKGLKRAGSRFNAYNALFSIRKQEEETLQTLINCVDEAMELCQTLRPTAPWTRS